MKLFGFCKKKIIKEKCKGRKKKIEPCIRVFSTDTTGAGNP
jgi:hypothetical protein